MGAVDEVAIYDRVLAPTEVAEHHASMLAGDHEAYGELVAADGPVAYWRLDEAAGVTALDEMGAFPGIYQGTPGYAEPGAS